MTSAYSLNIPRISRSKHKLGKAHKKKKKKIRQHKQPVYQKDDSKKTYSHLCKQAHQSTYYSVDLYRISN